MDTEFLKLWTAEPGNNQVVISRNGRILIINGDRGVFRYDTLDDFARAHATARSADFQSAVSQTSQSANPQPANAS